MEEQMRKIRAGQSYSEKSIWFTDQWKDSYWDQTGTFSGWVKKQSFTDWAETIEIKFG